MRSAAGRKLAACATLLGCGVVQRRRALPALVVDAFAFDVGNFESLVQDGSPKTAYLTLDPFN
jgi:hypothetical protein